MALIVGNVHSEEGVNRSACILNPAVRRLHVHDQ